VGVRNWAHNSSFATLRFPLNFDDIPNHAEKRRLRDAAREHLVCSLLSRDAIEFHDLRPFKSAQPPSNRIKADMAVPALNSGARTVCGGTGGTDGGEYPPPPPVDPPPPSLPPSVE
jgi:hypothetical protein